MDLNDEIARVAYENYEKNGYINGRDLTNWLEAERIVLARHAFQDKKEREEIKPSIKVRAAKKSASKLKKETPKKENKASKRTIRKEK